MSALGQRIHKVYGAYFNAANRHFWAENGPKSPLFFAILNMPKNRHFFGGESPQIVGRQKALKTTTLS